MARSGSSKLAILIWSSRKGIHAIIGLVVWVAAGALGAMVLLVVTDVVGRFLFRHPLLGTLELVELLGVVVIFFAVAYTEVRKGHVRVELIVSRLARRVETLVSSIMYFLSAAFFFVMGLSAGELMWSNLFPSKRTTEILSIPFAPFMFVVALGVLLLGLEILLNCLEPLSFREGEKGGSE